MRNLGSGPNSTTDWLCGLRQLTNFSLSKIPNQCNRNYNIWPFRFSILLWGMNEPTLEAYCKPKRDKICKAPGTRSVPNDISSLPSNTRIQGWSCLISRWCLPVCCILVTWHFHCDDIFLWYPTNVGIECDSSCKLKSLLASKCKLQITERTEV